MPKHPSLSPTNIAWSRHVWNSQTGCTLISPGCKNCYAKTMAKRLKKSGMKKYENEFQYTEHEDQLEAPIYHKKPTLIFVNSMSDVFIKEAKDEFIAAMFEVMLQAKHHTYQILTKRPQRMADFITKWLKFKRLESVPEHIWLGTSVENTKYLSRIETLRMVPASIRFVSFEPLLEQIKPIVQGIQWAIIGGESGIDARPFKTEWALEIIKECRKSNVPVFFKQVGGRTPNAGGNEIQGKTYLEYPKTKNLELINTLAN